MAIGTHVLAEACEQAARWAHGPTPPHFHVAVNLSAKQLTRTRVVDVIGDVLVRQRRRHRI